MQNINKWYRVLGLPQGAPQEEVKRAYRDLAQVWHPDRFSHNPRLQKKAADNLKRINEAYEGLRDYKPPPGAARPSRLSESFSAIAGIGDMLRTGQFQRRPRRYGRPRVVVPQELDPTGVHRVSRSRLSMPAVIAALVLAIITVGAVLLLLL